MCVCVCVCCLVPQACVLLPELHSVPGTGVGLKALIWVKAIPAGEDHLRRPLAGQPLASRALAV